MNRTKAIEKLKCLSWEDLDWLEQQCRNMKPKAKGVRVYNSNGDSTHRAEAKQSLKNYFEDVLHKHHGIY